LYEHRGTPPKGAEVLWEHKQLLMVATGAVVTVGRAWKCRKGSLRDFLLEPLPQAAAVRMITQEPGLSSRP
jgi:hypothetical protein